MYLYHISFRDLGKEVILTPRDPEVDGEPNTPRICCAPTVYRCFSAIDFNTGVKETFYYVYFTFSKEFVEPVSVVDAGITNEKWLLKPTKFKKLCKINTNNLREGNKGGRGNTHRLRGQINDLVKLEYLLHGM